MEPQLNSTGKRLKKSLIEKLQLPILTSGLVNDTNLKLLDLQEYFISFSYS